MENPGIYTLAALQISAAMSLKLLTPTTGLDGMTACNLEANFQYGSGGSTCSAIVATSFDGGTFWRHVARFDFTTAALVKTANLSCILTRTVGAYADLAAEGINDSLLGDRLAVYLVSTGVYVNTTLSVRVAAR